ncbi:uncharacterized protein LOC129568871 [Sitodiplosis mosellana]|uniref:uncharacterized protein LOC129568871 n=1 Tax=Sitodiplosis mosellana TaxID=263140 RepID=UPI0024445EBC|nr:uncharacterized protein LOC129568871 [Sitodiplosis mosellana]
MCFTIDQIERACGLLLLTEFNTFVYCCKSCKCEFESGSNLEVHILSKHQDDMEAIFENSEVFVDNFDASRYEIGPSDVKFEQIGSNCDEPNGDELDEESFTKSCEPNQQKIEVEQFDSNNEVSNERDEKLNEPILLESSDEDDTPLADLVADHGFDNVNSSDESTKANDDVSIVKKRRGRPIGWRKRRDSNEALTQKIIAGTKRPPGRPPGAKNKNYDSDMVTKYAINDNTKLSNKKGGRPTTGLFYCEMCPDLMFDGKMNLTRHMHRCHVLQKRKCEICNKIPRKGYERHMKKFHTVQPLHNCDLCDATFKTSISLVNHKLHHKGEKPFLCENCGKAFVSQQLYRDHKRIKHIDARKHPCKQCDRAFYKRFRLRDHIIAFHTTERPHICEICAKSFKSRSYLRVHKLTHGEKALKCRYCDRMFKLSENRHKHEVSIHKIEKLNSDTSQRNWNQCRRKMHILTEHQDCKGAVFENGEIFVDSIDASVYEAGPTKVEIERIDENVEEWSELNVIEPDKPNFNEGNKAKLLESSEAYVEESSNDDTPLADLLGNHGIDNVNSSDESAKAGDKVSIVKKQRGQPRRERGKNRSPMTRLQRKENVVDEKNETENDGQKQEEKGQKRDIVEEMVKTIEKPNQKKENANQKAIEKKIKSEEGEEERKKMAKVKEKQNKLEREEHVMQKKHKKPQNVNEIKRNVEITNAKRSRNKSKVNVKSVVTIETVPQRSLRSANKKSSRCESVEQKSEEFNRRVLRKYRSWPKNRVIQRNKQRCNKRPIDLLHDRDKNGGQTAKNSDESLRNTASYRIKRNKNVSDSSETDFGMKKNGVIERVMACKTNLWIETFTIGFQKETKSKSKRKENSFENDESIVNDSSNGTEEEHVETVLKSMKNQLPTPPSTKKRFNGDESDSDCSMNSYTSTYVLTSSSTSSLNFASTFTSTCTLTSASIHASTNGNFEYSHESNNSTDIDSGDNSKIGLSEASLEMQNRSNSSIAVEFDNDTNKVKESEEMIRKSVNIVHSLNDLPQMQGNERNVFDSVSDSDKNTSKIIDTKFINTNSNNDSGHSSGESIDIDLRSINDTIEIELKNNTDDKLIACLAGIDLTSLNIEVESEKEQSERVSNENEGRSIQIERESIKDNSNANAQKPNENSPEVLIERVDNTIHLSEELIDLNTEAPPPNLIYYVYQIPYESIEMAIQVGIPSTNDDPAMISTNQASVPTPMLTTQIFELYEAEISNENLLETDSIVEDGRNLISSDGNNVETIKNSTKNPTEDFVGKSVENFVKNPLKNMTKNVVTKSTVKPPQNFPAKSKTSIRRTQRGRPLGSKNLKPTDENIYSPDIFFCDMCPDKIFKSRLGLKKHINRHLTNEMRQKCTLCGQQPRNLENHMKIKHSNVRHKCDFCEISFKSKENQVIHIRTHTGERPYVCSRCGMTFRAQATWRKHENRVHRFMKKHRCEDCGRSFHSPYLLEDHIYAFHTGQRPYTCDTCGKNFATRHYLRTHKITHGEKVHKCRHCDKKFALADNRRKHERRFHKIE